MPRVAKVTGQIHTTESGDRNGDRVVIVHGAMDRSTSFGRVARHLADMNLIRYDRRGYGRSHDLGVGSLKDHVDDLLDVMGQVPAVVLGHSYGAVVALRASIAEPSLFRSVIAYECPASWESWWPRRSIDDATQPDPEQEAETFMRQAIGDRYWERLPARTREQRRSEGPALVADLRSLRSGPPFEPSEISVRVVSAYGSEADWWHRRASEELGDNVPNAELAVVAGAAHGVHLTHPTATVELIRRVAHGSKGL